MLLAGGKIVLICLCLYLDRALNAAGYAMSSGAWENKVVVEEVRRYSQDILILRLALS